MKKSMSELLKYDPEFYNIFKVHVNYFIDKKLSAIGIVSFDIIEFDRYMQKLGYRIEKDGSLENYIRKKYGKEAVDYIKTILHSKGVEQ